MTEEADAELIQEAEVSYDSMLGSVRHLAKICLIVSTVVFVAGMVFIGVEVSSINQTVTSHNTELSQTLHAACVLIKSDPHLPVPKGC